MTVRDKKTSNSADSTADVNEKTDKKEKLKVLREMWEAAKNKDGESQNNEPQNDATQENDDNE